MEPVVSICRDPGAARGADDKDGVTVGALREDRVCAEADCVPIDGVGRGGQEKADLIRRGDPKTGAMRERVELWTAWQAVAPYPLINRTCLKRKNSQEKR